MAAPSNQDGISINNEEHALDIKDRSTLPNIAEVEAEPSSRVHQESGVDQPIADVTEDSPLKSFESIGLLGDLDKTAESEETLGEICELHVYETRFNSKGEEVVLQVGATEGLDIEEIRSPDAALVLMRYYDATKALKETTLEIRSPYMRKAMAEIIRDYPGVDTQTAGILKISGKPHCVFHYRKELYAYAQASDDEDVKEHVTYLLRYMEQALRKEIASYETHMVANTKSPGLDFDSLWMTFRPGDLLYHNRNGEGQICRLKSMRMYTNDWKPLRYAKYWYLSCEIINCDGEDFIYIWDHTRIFAYDGYRPVSDLNILPLRFHKDQMSIRESLLVRGNTFLSFLGVHHRNYHGTARFLKDDEENSMEDDEYDSYKAKEQYETIQADGRVIVDCEEYASNIDGSIGAQLPGSKLISGKERGYEKLCDDDILLCSPEIAGFSLQHRRWGLFKVSGLGIISFNQTAFDALVLPQQYKELLKSLVKAHQKEVSNFDDLVKGKGKGLLFLLHGEPGVGKTLTAESISELTQRPLYTIGAEELGQYSAAIERELKRTLKLATKWNALVLLDEADVFMVQRSSHDKRNDIVSVLLRIMEYFEGVMFMTTNRLDSIDPAFASRIHLILAYPRLSNEARRAVWAKFISSISTSLAPAWLDNEFLDKVASYDLNGREIKNVTRVACAIAANDQRELAPQDILERLATTFSYMTGQLPVQDQTIPWRVYYKNEFALWFRNFPSPRDFLLLIPSAYVVGPLVAIGLSSALRHGIKLGLSVYQRFRR